MKKVVLLFGLAALIFSCSNQKKSNESAQQEAAVVYSVDDLYDNAESLVDKEVTVKGTVMHVCKEGGVRCFLMGSNEDVIIRVEAGEDIGHFTQEQMGSELEITGVFTEVRTEADAHNPGEHEAEHAEDEDMESAHKAISESQEGEETVYFIKGLKSKEIIAEQ